MRFAIAVCCFIPYDMSVFRYGIVIIVQSTSEQEREQHGNSDNSEQHWYAKSTGTLVPCWKLVKEQQHSSCGQRSRTV